MLRSELKLESLSVSVQLAVVSCILLKVSLTKFVVELIGALCDSRKTLSDMRAAIFFLSNRLEWPVRTISFSYDGKLLASASEDLMIDIAYVESGKCLYPVIWY